MVRLGDGDGVFEREGGVGIVMVGSGGSVMGEGTGEAGATGTVVVLLGS